MPLATLGDIGGVRRALYLGAKLEIAHIPVSERKNVMQSCKRGQKERTEDLKRTPGFLLFQERFGEIPPEQSVSNGLLL